MTPVDSDEQDLTRKQRREQAREDRKAAEQAMAADAARRRRLSMLGGAVAVVVVAIVVILIATSGGSSSQTGLAKKGSGGESKTVALVNSEIGGIPQSGNAIGSPTAPVTLAYFGDLECPICRDFTEGALPPLIAKQVRDGKLRIEYRSMETATREPETFKNQQIAALAAGKQNKMWNYLETFYHEQGEESSGYVTESYLQGIARQVPGLNLSQWQADRSNAALQAQLAADTQESNNQGFTGTPSFLIGHTGGAMKKLESSNTAPSRNRAASNRPSPRPPPRPMSSRSLRITLIVLATIGVGLASYLTYIHYAGIAPLCGKGGGTCEKVQTSIYSNVGGVPVALLGLIGYIAILGTLLVPEDERTRFATAAIALGGFGFSCYLTYREVFSLKEICEWCVGSAVLMTVIMCLSLWRFLRGEVRGPPGRADARGRTGRAAGRARLGLLALRRRLRKHAAAARTM